MKSGLLFPDTVIQEAFNKKETWNNVRNYWANYESFEANKDEISNKFKGKVVIMVNAKVIFSSGDMDKIRKKLHSLPNLYEAYIRYVPAENELLLL